MLCIIKNIIHYVIAIIIVPVPVPVPVPVLLLFVVSTPYEAPSHWCSDGHWCSGVQWWLGGWAGRGGLGLAFNDFQ